MSKEQDLLYVRQSEFDLEKYLLSKEIYWPLQGKIISGSQIPRLTLGELLLSLRRINAYPLQPDEQEQFSILLERIRSLKEHWRTHWENKALAEFPQRFRLWQNYLRDYYQEPGDYYRSFPREVERRAILKVLSDEVVLSRQYKADLESVDTLLNRKFHQDSFVWNEILSSQFPARDFWFLYGSLPPS